MLGAFLYPAHHSVQADTTKAACEAQKGSCKEVCNESDDTSQGLCSDLTNSGTYCCIPKQNAGNTQIIIDTKICEDNEGRCVNFCITGQKVGACKTGGGICCAGSDAIAQKIQAANITTTIKDPVLQQQALTSIGVQPTTSGSPAVGSYNYTLLEKIPGIDSQNLNLAAYLSAIYKLAIWIVGLCALFMFLVGAFMYMLSAANTSKMGSAKSIMQDALIGLVLALASYLILYVINPDLVNLKLPTVSMSSGAPEGTPNTAKTPGASWPNDSATRSELDTAGISFNKANCVTEGDKSSPCTSVAELGRAAIDGLKNLKTACTACHDSKNDIMVNGGTEYWFHSAGTSHQKGNSVVDLNRTPDLLAYIQQSGQVACSLGGRPVYRLNGADYWDEDDKHFHVSFGGKICK